MKPGVAQTEASFTLRAAVTGDVPRIHELLDIYAKKGDLLPRPLNNIYRQLQQFFVIASGDEIVACASLEIFTRDLAEIRSLAVDSAYQGHGLGHRMVSQLIDNARGLGLKRLMALTFVPPFFHRFGFVTVTKDDLPEKVWGVCVHCPIFDNCKEIPVLLHI